MFGNTLDYGNKGFLVTDFELQHEDLSRGSTLNKHKKWSAVKEALQPLSIASGELKEGRKKRSGNAIVTFYDVPVSGMFVNNSNEETNAGNIRFDGTSSFAKAWRFLNRYKSHSLFAMISDYKLKTFIEGVEPYQMVKKVFSPLLLESEIKKEMNIQRVKDYKVITHYGSLKAKQRFSPSSNMIAEDNISHTVKSLYNQKNGLRNYFNSLYMNPNECLNQYEVQNCFYPDTSELDANEANSYCNWHLEFDVKKERRLKGLLIAGKALELSCVRNKQTKTNKQTSK